MVMAALGSTARSAEAETTNTEDAAVLNAVLLDLLLRPDSRVEPQYTTSPVILYVSTEPLTRTLSAKQLLYRMPQGETLYGWDKLTEDETSQSQEAAVNIIDRTDRGAKLPALTSPHERIVIYSKKDKHDTRDPWRRQLPQVYHAFVPGYSRSGNVAVVYVVFPWSGHFHSGNATYILRKNGNAWEIIVRQLILYV
jgi:hypothetical protein